MSRGAVIRTGAEVVGLEWHDGSFTASTPSGPVTARRVVLVTGNDLNRFSSLWGGDLAISDDPAQVGATEPLAPMVHHLVYYAGGQLTFKQAKAGTLLIGGGWSSDIDPVTGENRVNPQNLVANMRVALRVGAVTGRCPPDPHLARQGSGHPGPIPDHRPGSALPA